MGCRSSNRIKYSGSEANRIGRKPNDDRPRRNFSEAIALDLLPMVSLMLHPLFQTLEPFLVPICFVCAWVAIATMAMNLHSAISSGVEQAKQMHQIPCANCIFFTNDHRLKCPVNPTIAMSEEAIDCGDYRQRSSYGAMDN